VIQAKYCAVGNVLAMKQRFQLSVIHVQYTVCDPSLTLTQLCVLLKTMLFCRAYEAPPPRLCDSIRVGKIYVFKKKFLGF